jgi:RNA polymerase sigma-70 factor (ECF subfamily)
MGIDGVVARGQGRSVTAAEERTETALVERARHGDHDAFAALLDGRLEATLRMAMAILGDEADARDVTQAAFVQAWVNLPSLRDPALFPAWFGRIVVNTARSALRGRKRRVVREVPVSALPDEATAFVSRAAGHEDHTAELDRLERAFDRIGPAERTVLWLHHYEELSLAEIGARIGVPSRTVKSRLYTARRALERALQVEDR